ncbi:MAG: hypothetical protein JWN70_3295, partial [Planctomycetaceae bacterium]|nr:hypothetical protein [Planctomycetaceae bacterium]
CDVISHRDRKLAHVSFQHSGTKRLFFVPGYPSSGGSGAMDRRPERGMPRRGIAGAFGTLVDLRRQLSNLTRDLVRLFTKKSC